MWQEIRLGIQVILKKFPASSLIQSTPKLGEPLYLYLAVSKHSISIARFAKVLSNYQCIM